MTTEYDKRGVSATKEEVRAAVAGAAQGLFPGAFCKVVPDLSEGYAAVLHADGAGTKSQLAYLHYREHGDAEVFVDIAQDSAVMNVDDIGCVGAVGPMLLCNTIGRNAHRVGADGIEAVVRGYELFAERMRGAGIEIATAGGETADVGDLVSTIIVDSTVYARLPVEDVVDCSRIQPGHVILGLASDGQASYEDRPNSGIGSNGFTLARHVLLEPSYGRRYPETFSPTISPDAVYGGPFRMEDPLPGTAFTVGEALLSPTRSYLPVIKEVLERHRGAVSGLVHCTGGGQTKCLSFGDGLRYRKTAPFAPPPIFELIMREGGVPAAEMYQAFNMGHRMEIYCDSAVADEIIGIAKSHDIDAAIVGHVETGSRPGVNELLISHLGEELRYERRT